MALIVRKARADNPPRILIYGPPKIGKTTLASEFPSPIYLQIEDGTPGDLELDSLGDEPPKTFDEVMDGLASLYSDEHDFRTIVVDSITEMQRLVWNKTCQVGDEYGNVKANIEDFGYGKGYVKSLDYWRMFIEGLDALRKDKGMAVVLIAHSKVERFDDPEATSYDRYSIDLHKGAVGILERDSDAILLMKHEVTIKTEDKGFNKERARGDGGNTVWINCRPRPAFVAGNRYGLPDKLMYRKGSGFSALSEFLPGMTG
jgi:hypothetical protein